MDSNDRDFQRVVKNASAVCMALGAGFVGSIKQLNPTARFEFDAVSVAGAILGGLGVLFGWQFIFGSGGSATGRAPNRGRRFGIVALIFLCAMTSAFVYALKDLSPEKRNEVAIGALSGIAAIAIIGTVVWRIICFLETDYHQGIEDERNHDHRD